MSAHMSFSDVSRVSSIISASSGMEESKYTRKKEEDSIHNPKRKTGLEHRALFIRREMQTVKRYAAQDSTDLVATALCDMGAVLATDATQFVDTCDEGPDETEIDEGDKEGVVFRSVVGEESADCPGGGEDGDNEEDEDVVGC